MSSTRPVIPEAILHRKGAVRTSAVPAEVKTLIDQGLIETVNLSEWLVVDHIGLARHILPRVDLAKALPSVERSWTATVDKSTSPKRNKAIVAGLLGYLSGKSATDSALPKLGRHTSDVVRGWACDVIGMAACYSLSERLERIRPLAADGNMGVRECAWMGLREPVAAELQGALLLLRAWVVDPDFRVRRFASELTRPRGVWCRHLEELKADPAPALPLLEPLKSDPEKYVRDSVGNWLNDAAKSQPAWVRKICSRWSRESKTKETAYVVKRALRTIGAA